MIVVLFLTIIILSASIMSISVIHIDLIWFIVAFIVEYVASLELIWFQWDWLESMGKFLWESISTM